MPIQPETITISKLYSISSLEKITGVPRRTIHYYVKEKLLPRPDGRGPSARYSENHRRRLRLITLMKQATHLRLEGIREAMEFMSEPEMEAQVARLELWAGGIETGTPVFGTEESPFLDSGALDEAPGTEEAHLFSMAAAEPAALMQSERAETEITRLSTPLRGLSPERLYNKIMTMRSKTPQPEDTGDANTWTRIRITNDLEIHFRPGAGRRFHKKLGKLLSMARKSFDK